MMVHRHPPFDDLHAFATGTLDAPRRSAVAKHASACPSCQERLRFMQRIERSVAVSPAPQAPDALLARILRSRDGGHRVILPVESPPRSRERGWRAIAGLGAAAAILAVATMVLRTPELVAGASEGALVTRPDKPRAGAVVTVEYTPAQGGFAGEESLVLRARLRTARDEMYSVSDSQVQRIATLHLTRDGRFEGRFTLPDSVVYVALAVEDLRARHVDDHTDRPWELLAHTEDGRPTYDALNQRAADMMGRSWTEGYASARLATEHHPERADAWALRAFFERALSGDKASDSAARATTAQLHTLMAQRKRAARLPAAEIGAIYFEAYVTMRRPGATRADSSEYAYWWSRLLREYPHHPQIVQHLAIYMDEKKLGARRALDSLEHIYQRVAPDGVREGGGNLFNVALQLASQVGDDSLALVWRARSNAGRPDSVRAIAAFLARTPRYRQAGIVALRSLIRRPSETWAPGRRLSQDSAAYAVTIRHAQQRMLAALGRALVASGDVAAGRDTLVLAADGSWDPDLFREIASALAMAGDTIGAARQRARLAVDPNTSTGEVDSLHATGRRVLGAVQWQDALRESRALMRRTLLTNATPRAPGAGALLQQGGGGTATVTALLNGAPGAVIFWSRHCGFALEALPEITAAIAKLREDGTRVLFVVDEPPSPDLDAFLRDKQVDWPVYHDVKGSTAAAFRNFGTPTYYVVDGRGRIWFDEVERVPDLIAQVDAVKSMR